MSMILKNLYLSKWQIILERFKVTFVVNSVCQIKVENFQLISRLKQYKPVLMDKIGALVMRCKFMFAIC